MVGNDGIFIQQNFHHGQGVGLGGFVFVGVNRGCNVFVGVVVIVGNSVVEISRVAILGAVKVGIRGARAEGVIVAIASTVGVEVGGACTRVAVGVVSSSVAVSRFTNAITRMEKSARLIASKTNTPMSSLLRLFMNHFSSRKVIA
jgi:hypothetical protein